MTENRYNRGKIYKIVSNHTDKVYIGSTVQSLSKRIGGHRSQYKRYLEGKISIYTSFEIMSYPDAKIYLIENFKCQSKNELECRERYFIESMNCCNKFIPTRTPKEYREDNKDKIKDKIKKYREDNKDKIKKQKEEYYLDNKDKKKVKNKEYYKLNNDKIKEKVKCGICGSIVCKGALRRHQKTIKCTSHKNSLNNNEE